MRKKKKKKPKPRTEHATFIIQSNHDNQRTIVTRCYYRDGLLEERRTRDRKVVSSSPGRSGGIIFFSIVSFLYRLSFSIRSTPMLPQWHVKEPGHSAKSAGDRIHLNTHTSFTQRSRSVLTMPLCRHSLETYQGRRSHATRQGTHGLRRLSSLSYCGLVLA